MPDITGYHHLNLSVSDVVRSGRWYGELLGLVKVREGEIDGMAKLIMRHPGTGALLGFTGHGERATGGSFSEFATGLDHVAFGVRDRAELEAWAGHLDALGVPHSGITSSVLGELIAFRDPDNIQLEVFAPYPQT